MTGVCTKPCLFPWSDARWEALPPDAQARWIEEQALYRAATQRKPKDRTRAASGRGGRPMGPIAVALLAAAAAGPGTALQLACRAQVGRAAAAYTCTRLVASGHLRQAGAAAGPRGRPAVVLELATGAGAPTLADVLHSWRA